MLRKISVLTICMVLVLSVAMPAFALGDVALYAETPTEQTTDSGFYGIGSAEKVTITPQSSAGDMSQLSADVNDDGTYEVFYAKSDQLLVEYSGATSGKYYVVWLVKGNTLPSSVGTTVYYVNQITADSTSESFLVYPRDIEEDMSMTLFITSNDGTTSVSVPLSYSYCSGDESHWIEPASYTLGDVNGDSSVNASDLTALAKHLAEIQVITDANLLKAADCDKNGTPSAADLTKLARFVASIITSLE